jgi:hypothetical protein
VTAEGAYLIAEERTYFDSALLDIPAKFVCDLLRTIFDEVLYGPGSFHCISVLGFFGPIFRLLTESDDIIVEAIVCNQSIFYGISIAEIVMRQRNKVHHPMSLRLPGKLEAAADFAFCPKNELELCRFTCLRDMGLDSRLAFIQKAKIFEALLAIQLGFEAGLDRFRSILYRDPGYLHETILLSDE